MSGLFDQKKPDPAIFTEKKLAGNKLAGPSGIPGFDAVIGPKGAEIGVVPHGTDPDQVDAIVSRTEAKREIAKAEGIPNLEEKHLDALVQETIERKPLPPPVHPGAFDYLGV